jgi:NAD(P)-dependent dehydrogenase (short-subunit alcohol dehydrogenase family)
LSSRRSPAIGSTTIHAPPGRPCRPCREETVEEGGEIARLAGKVAFTTGAGTGIGRASAILFAREGAKVAIAEIDAQAGDETGHLAGNEAIAIRADVTDPDSLQSAIRATVDKFGRLEVLHNNAGGSTAQDDTAVNAIAYGPLVSTSSFSVEGHLVRATFRG